MPILSPVVNVFMSLGRRVRTLWRSITMALKNVINRWPLASFLVVFGVVIGLAVFGNTLRSRTPVPEVAEPVAKKVEVFSIGQAPKLTMRATVEKTGVLTIVAQSPGVVQKVLVSEGDQVKRGSRIMNTSTNYVGGNAASIGRQIAWKNSSFLAENLPKQLEAVELQRQIANSADTQADKLREIARKSLDDTKGLISLNEEILRSIDENIAYLESNNTPDGANDGAILAAKQGKSQVLAALTGLRSGLRNTEYTASDDGEVATLGNLQRDLTLKQLELQEKSLKLNAEVAQLNTRLAKVQESLMFPAAPCPGVVERVYVHVGQVVAPGTPIATIRGSDNPATISLLVSGDVARKVSRIEPTEFHTSTVRFSVAPRYISQEATTGSLHTILYDVPEAYAAELSNATNIQADVPIGYAKTVASAPFIPLDAIYQTETEAFIYIVEKPLLSNTMTAKVRTVTLGNVYGAFVEVKAGLSAGDAVITDRSVSDGELVTTLEEPKK